MAFRRPHPRQRRTCEEYKAELEEENYHLHSELQTEVDTNRQNEKRINQLEQDYSWCEQDPGHYIYNSHLSFSKIG